MRLTTDMRHKVLEALEVNMFVPAYNGFISEAKELLEAAMKMSMSAEHYALYKSIPDGWLNATKSRFCIVVQDMQGGSITDKTCGFEIGWHPMPYNHNGFFKVTPDSQVGITALDLHKRFTAYWEDRKKFMKAAQVILNNSTTVEKLFKSWPELPELLGEYMSVFEPTVKPSLPATLNDDIRNLARKYPPVKKAA